MSTLNVDVAVNYRQLKEASKNVSDLKKNLKELSTSQTNIKINEHKAGIPDALFPQQAASAAVIERQNRVMRESLRDVVNAGKSTWRDRYWIGAPVGGGDGLPIQGSAGAGGGFFRNGFRTAGRMAGYAAAIGGGFSLFSLLHDSVNQAASYGAGEADLLMRGGNDRFRHNAKLQGYTPEEALAIQNVIGSRTGFQGKELNDASYQATWYGRRMGISGQSVANYIGGTNASTGWSGDSTSTDSIDKQLKYLRDTAVALGARGRIEEVLHNNQQIMSTIVQGRGGKELSTDERLGMLAMQMGLWNTPGQIGKGASGTNILATMDQSIRGGGGTPGEKIFLAQALGVEGVKSLKDLWEFEKRMNEGGSRRNVKAVLDYSKKIAAHLGYSPEDTEQFAMRNVRDVLHLNENQTEAVFSSKFLESLEGAPVKALKKMQGTAEGRKRLGAADIDPFSLKGNQHRRTVAGFANAELKVGEKLLPYVDDLKSGMTRLVDGFSEGDYLGALTGALKDNPLGWLMLTSVGLNVAGNMPKPIPLPLPGGGKGKRLTSLVPSPTTTGILAGLNELRPKEANPASYAELDRMIGQGRPNHEIMGRAQQLDAIPEKEGGILGLTQAIRELVTELRVWLHKVNNDPINNPNMPRYQMQN